MAFPNRTAASLLAAFIVFSLVPGVAASTVTRLDDDFVNTEARWFWTSGSTGSGAAHISGPDASLLIESGVNAATTTWVETVQSFDTSSGFEQILHTRCAPKSNPIGPGDTAFWGFRHEVSGHTYSIGFWVKWGPNGSVLEARVRNAMLTRSQLMPGIDVMATNDYRIDVLEDRARFFVNDVEVWEWSGNEVPQGLLHVRLEKSSPGRNKVLQVESVLLEEVLTSRTSLFDSEPDGSGGAALPTEDGTLGDEPGQAPAAVGESSWADIKAAYR